MIVSLSLVGSFSNSYADVGDFISSFDGTDNGGVEFEGPAGVAVDSNDRIIITDITLDTVQIFDSTGSFIIGFDGSVGGTPFSFPSGVAVDNTNRIIVTDLILKTVQIFDSTGAFVLDFDGSDGGTPFDTPQIVAVDNTNRIIVADSGLNIVQIFNPAGTFVDGFDGTDGGTRFIAPWTVAVDNNDRILVTDLSFNDIQVFDSTGTFDFSFDGTDGGGVEFERPYAITVDTENRILVTDTGLDLVQIFDSSGSFITSFDGSDGGTPFDTPLGVAVDNTNRIIVTDTGEDLVQIFGAFDADTLPVSDAINGSTGSATSDGSDDPNGGCADCTPPTLGLDPFDRERLVDNGFSYNGNSVQVDTWHTPYPLITTQVGQLNTVEIIVYENQGIHNMRVVQFGLGATEIGQSLHDVEVLIEVWLYTFNLTHNAIIEKIIINDKDNLIENYTVVAVVDVVKCQTDSYDEKCLKVTLQYSYREDTINTVMLVNVTDISHNTQNFYFNDGVQVLGKSLNEPPTYVIQNKQTSQQTENLTLTLTRTDKINHIWTDENGIEYLQVSETRFDRITPHTPMECTDPPLSEINVPTRNNCNFRELINLWSDT